MAERQPVKKVKAQKVRIQRTSPVRAVPAGADVFAKAQASATGSNNAFFGQALTPLRAALNYVSQPAYMVGNTFEAIAKGDVSQLGQAAKNSLNFLVPGTQAFDATSGDHTFVSNVLKDKGWLPGGVAGTVLGFGADVVSDPLSYVSFGGAGLARKAATEGGEAALKFAEANRTGQAILDRVTQQAEKGAGRAEGKFRSTERVGAVGTRGAARGKIDIKFGVPFTGNRVGKTFENVPVPGQKVRDALSEIAARAKEQPTVGTITGTTAEAFRTGGKKTAERRTAAGAAQSGRREGEILQREIDNEAKRLIKQTEETAKSLGVPVTKVLRSITLATQLDAIAARMGMSRQQAWAHLDEITGKGTNAQVALANKTDDGAGLIPLGQVNTEFVDQIKFLQRIGDDTLQSDIAAGALKAIGGREAYVFQLPADRVFQTAAKRKVRRAIGFQGRKAPAYVEQSSSKARTKEDLAVWLDDFNKDPHNNLFPELNPFIIASRRHGEAVNNAVQKATIDAVGRRFGGRIASEADAYLKTPTKKLNRALGKVAAQEEKLRNAADNTAEAEAAQGAARVQRDAARDIASGRAPVNAGENAGIDWAATQEMLAALSGKAPTPAQTEALAAANRQLETIIKTGIPENSSDFRRWVALQERIRTVRANAEKVASPEGVQKSDVAGRKASLAKGIIQRAQTKRDAVQREVAALERQIARNGSTPMRARRLRGAQARLATADRAIALARKSAPATAGNSVMRELEAIQSEIARLADRAVKRSGNVAANTERQIATATQAVMTRAQQRANEAVLRATRALDAAVATKRASAIRRTTQDLERARAAVRDADNAAIAARGEERAQRSALRKSTRQVEKEAKNFERELLNADRSAKFKSPRVAMDEYRRLQKTAGYETLQGIADRTNMIVPTETANAINLALNSIRRITKDVGELGQLMYFLQRFTSSWKSLALLTPGYISRNAQSDMLFSWLAGGRNPKSWLTGAKAMQVRAAEEAGQKGHKYAEDIINVGGEDMTVSQLVQQAREDQAIGLSQTRGELLNQAQKQAGAKRAPIGSGKVAKKFQGANEWREDWTKFGLYIDLRQQGMSRVDAAERVRDFLFDYGDVSQFVGEMRRFALPFVTWAAKAYPRTVKSFAENPGFFANVNALESGFNTDYGNGLDFSTLPAGREQSFALPNPFSDKPNDQLLMDPGNVAPWTVLNSINPTSIESTGRSIGAFLNPLIKTPIELFTGYSIQQGRTAPKRVNAPGPIAAIGNLGIDIPTMDFGPKKDLYTGETQMGFSRAWDSVFRLLPAYSQVQSAVGGLGIPGMSNQTDRIGAVRFGTGLNLVPIDRARALALAQRFSDTNREKTN